MYFNCTVKQVGSGGATLNWEYDFMFYSDGLVVYDRTCRGEKYSGRFNALSPGDHANTVAYKAFVVILKLYGLI